MIAFSKKKKPKHVTSRKADVNVAVPDGLYFPFLLSPSSLWPSFAPRFIFLPTIKG